MEGEKKVDDFEDIKEFKEKKQHSCLGVTYFSQKLYDAHKGPVCAGFKARHDPPTATPATDSVPAGDFKFVCLGYSLYDDPKQPGNRQQNFEGDDAKDDIDLPYCEGVEVVSAVELQRRPVLATETVPAGPGPDSAQQPEPVVDDPQRSNRRYVPGTAGAGPNEPGKGMDWADTIQRVGKMQGRLLAQMEANVDKLAKSAKQTVKKLGDAIWGKGDGKG